MHESTINNQQSTINNQQSTRHKTQDTRHKICEFFEKHKAICITTGILCLPLGIAYATIYGVAKALDKHQKPISNRQLILKVQQRKTSPQMNLSHSVVDFLTDQNLMIYANTDDGTQRKTDADKCTSPESPLSRNKIAFTCYRLTDDQLTKIINDGNIPREYKEIAYCVGSMRTMLGQCTSEELSKALQNRQPPTHTLDDKTFDVTNIDSGIEFNDAFLPDKTEKLEADKILFHYEYNEFWSEDNAFNRALLLQMIIVELETNTKHIGYYDPTKDDVENAKTAANALFTTSLH